MPLSSGANRKPMSNLSEKVTAGVAVLALAGGLITVWMDSRSEQAAMQNDINTLWSQVQDVRGVDKDYIKLEERVDTLLSTNERTLDVLDRLAESVERLSVSVARLDERTAALERDPKPR